MNDMLEALRSALADRYTVERVLGRGGMSTVFLGRDLKHRRDVAIKVLRPDLAAYFGVARFKREIETVAALTHPHILPLYDSGEANGLAFFVMPFVAGETLQERLARDGQLSVDETLLIAREIADGLEYAHGRGCVHRDIKPANILLSEGHAIIADFGVARAINAAGGEKITSSGMAVGTPAYLSPEQAGGEPGVDGRTDIYALGCVVYEMLAGAPPFVGPSVQAVIAQHVLEAIPSLETVRPGLPDHVAPVVEKALSKRPADRFATAAAFSQALTGSSGIAGGPSATSPRRRLSLPLVALVAVLGSVLFLFGRGLLPTGEEYAVSQPRQKFIVLPHGTGRTSAEERVLAQDAEDELTRLLTGWDEARVVPAVSKAGLMFDLGLLNPVRTTLQESIALARRARVGTVVMLTVRIQGDTAQLEALLYDAATSEPVGAPVVSAAPAADVFALVAPVAVHILDFSGAPEQLRTFRRESSDLEAIRAFQEGRKELERGRLQSAEASLRSALEEDSTFARAHYLLALTLYWQAARDVLRFPELGGEIRRHVAAARQHVSSLVYRDSLYVEAFFAFQNGAYDVARQVYRELVRTDSTDTYAWLLLGSVEYRDPWAVAGPDGALHPRGDYNLAREAFTRTVRLSPDFFLGYGHLFDIHQQLSGAVWSGVCYGFQRPSDEVVLIWEMRDAEDQMYACPIVRDSIEWVDRSTLSELDAERLYAGAERFLDGAFVELQRWSDYAPDDPRPEEELSNWLLARREQLPRAGDLSSGDSLVTEALRHTERALTLRADTSAEDLVRLGGLLLSTGNVDRALAAVERAIQISRRADGDSRLLPMAAANVYLATGQVGRALEIVVPVASRRRISTRDTVAGAYIQLRADAALARLRVYGATGLAGPRLQDAVAEMEETWARAGYSERQKSLIRKTAAGWIWPALVLDDGWMRSWFAADAPSDPLVAGLAAAGYDLAAARRALDRAAAQSDGAPVAPVRAYLLGTLAERLDQPERAIGLYGHLDRWPLSADALNEGWGLRSVSHLRRAQLYDALGDTVAARTHYRRFLELWDTADPESEFVMQEARAALERLR